ncbi:hypothetical protein MXB_2813 [Myxobolus squamalis]|nr:hypothetical protein MXB_2813 [Myxobolus squamalis]
MLVSSQQAGQGKLKKMVFLKRKYLTH